MNMDLVTSLVVLATAVVGLYAAVGTLNREKDKGGTGPSAAADAALATVLSVLPVLLIPAALLGFMYFMNTYLDQARNLGGGDARYAIPAGIPDSEIMYLMSELVWDQSVRQEVLQKVIGTALALGDYETVLKAARDLNPTSQADPVLVRAIDQLAGSVPAAQVPAE